MMDMIAAAYGFGTRQGPSMLPTMDKGQSANVHTSSKVNLQIFIRAAVNDGTRLPPDQRQRTTALLPQLADVLIINDAGKNPLPMASNNIHSQGNILQLSEPQFMGRSAAFHLVVTLITQHLPYHILILLDLWAWLMHLRLSSCWKEE